MLLPHHGFTILLTENPKVLIENSVSTLVFTKVLTVFLLEIPVICLCRSYTELTWSLNFLAFLLILSCWLVDMAFLLIYSILKTELLFCILFILL